MADKYITEKRVKINNKIIEELGTLVKENDVVKLDDNIIKLEQKVYIMLNKPKGYITTSKEQFDRKKVLDLIKEKDRRVYPVGRLDMYTEGLLILTNDGEFTNKIIHPRNHVKKTYEVMLNKDIIEKDIDTLKNGIDIGEYITSKAEVHKENKGKITISIYEGKNRQIRKMVEAVGYKVINLKRIAIGNLKLENLALGKYKYLTEMDLNKIFENKKSLN